MTPSMAMLRRPDGETRMVCLGCSEELQRLGMIRVVEEKPMKVIGAPDGTFSAILYEVVPPYTVEHCRFMAAGHVGPPAWGE